MSMRFEYLEHGATDVAVVPQMLSGYAETVHFLIYSSPIFDGRFWGQAGHVDDSYSILVRYSWSIDLFRVGDQLHKRWETMMHGMRDFLKWYSTCNGTEVKFSAPSGIHICHLPLDRVFRYTQ